MNHLHFPSYTRLERIADACVHAVSILFSVAAAVLLLIGAIGTLPLALLIGLIVYSIGMVGMFAASAAYNLVSHAGVKEILRRLDHAAIFVMIAGSYTPFALVVGGAVGHALLAAVWAVAAVGIVIKLRFPRRFDRISVVLYLFQGWMVLIALELHSGRLTGPGARLAGGGRHRLHAGRRVPSDGAAALSQCDLAHLRARWRSVPVRCSQGCGDAGRLRVEVRLFPPS